METVARLLQVAGLAIVGAGLFLGLAERITAGPELGFMAVGAMVFVAGTLLGKRDGS